MCVSFFLFLLLLLFHTPSIRPVNSTDENNNKTSDTTNNNDDKPVLTVIALVAGSGRMSLKLLQDMHNALSCSSSSSCIPMSTVVEPHNLRVVEDDTPLSFWVVSWQLLQRPS
ncbi:uncharacterized protein TM35_001081040 [Trypanosoma theileri]|uniref:Uncharacterized protein n=1 Tax=Trypanosoma theileri TaxID=67003 RepID=A0A1X0NEA0_9TRYP|nr:uncharacterized protein TM35_001081040 [Trypanosoma theileri]ORC81743.1 hypothetical protein TM35_001081040 [Trypanosoma theileri]